jgi:hypothetical protein
MNAILYTKQVGGLDLIKKHNRYYKGYSGASRTSVSVKEAVGKNVKHFIVPTDTHLKAVGKDSARVLVGKGVKLVKNTDKGFKPYSGPLAEAGTDYYFEYKSMEFVPYTAFELCYLGELPSIPNDHYVK